MGTGDYICVTMSGGAPWGFRLQGGKEFHEMLHVSKVRGKSKASVAGLCVGDEVISINGTPCTDIPYSEVVGLIEKSTDSLQILVKRAPSKPQSAENRNGQQENRELCTESTMLEIRLGPETAAIEQNTSEIQYQSLYSKSGCDAALIRGTKDHEVMLEHKITPRVIETSKDGITGDITLTRRIEEGRPGAMVELQLSLPQDIHLGNVGSPTLTLVEVDQCRPPETEHRVLQDEVASEHLDGKEQPKQQASATFQIVGKQQAKIIPAGQAGEACFPRVELILDCSGREKEPRSQSDRGCVISGVEGGQTEAPPSTVSFGIKAEDSEEGEEAQQAERELIKPNKHRARHARLRRSESLSEKQVKEAKSKCKSIALLLTAAPNPNSKGVLMFKKRRQRARKFTLTSYGTGELERQVDDEDDNEDEENKENTFDVTFYGASESDLDDELFSDPENNTQIVTFDWDTGLVEVEKKLISGDAMEELPETKGKGVLMFARRKQRMDQITAEQEEVRKHSVEEKVTVTENVNNTVSLQTQKQQSIKMQSCVSKSYIEVSNSQTGVQNGFAAQEAIPSFQSSSNRTPKPFGGSQNRAAIPFSPTRNIASPMSDVPAPPPYSSVTPPPEPRFQVSSPVSAKTQAAVWTPSFSTEQIASRDERISVPANKTGILQEAKRRSTKPMFTFKEQPKLSPNPELLSLVQTREGKRGTGNESGPEEDYLSLGAEACNFMQAHAGKQKTPPPVAPKPMVKSPTAIPTSPVWAPPTATNVAQPNYNSYNPPTAAPVWAPPSVAPAPQVFSSQYPPQSAHVEANVAQPKQNSYNPPTSAPAPQVFSSQYPPQSAHVEANVAQPTHNFYNPPTSAPAPQVFSSQYPPQSAHVEAIVAQPTHNSYNPPTSLNLSGPLRGPPETAPAANQLYTPKTPTTPSGTSAAGTAYEMPALRGKGAELFARRQSRMEKYVVDSSTVQEKAARTLSPTPSLPPSWKYSSNVRAPPPLAYNPIQSPLYPLAANKSVSKIGSSAAKKKPTKTLSALEVMKHQPYQLNASLFTFQSPSDTASDTDATKKNVKADFNSSTKQAKFNKPVNTAPSSNFIPAPENSQPVYNTQPSYQSSAFTPSNETYSMGYSMQPRQESPIATLIAPPRPKFSAKKAGVAAQERDDGRSMSFPARSLSSASSQPFGSPISPMLFQPAPGYGGKSATTPETPGKKITPWEAAAKSPLGFVDDAFMPQNVHESVSANVVSAARRKTLPGPPEAWKTTPNVSSTSPYAHRGLYENKRNSISTVPKNVVSAPSLQCGYQLRHPYASTHSITNVRPVPLDTRSEYGMSTSHNPNFNPYPRAWRR
ncbi:synaptopodin-2 isoform X2 [Pyxicephalus adspersus]|uniref:synaptopodin-2 isoform X2 n=1 Tax=Pyxicephalus adspersus TaxID=30357 RepID=UPI003B5B5416